MTFDQALEYLSSALKFGINPSLETITELCAGLGNPQRRFEVLQVAGTNGKSSTARMAAAILKGQGRSVGLYTSPHLETYTERIEIGGRKIYPGEFASAFSRVVPVAEEVLAASGRDGITEFELLTAAAFVAFDRADVDTAVLEVGLGGRWDATSVCDARVAVVTTIDLDHTERLGTSTGEIAEEKAQIVKENSTAVVGELDSVAWEAIEARARDVGAALLKLDRDFSYKLSGNRLQIDGVFGSYPDLELSVLGKYQGENAALAVVACESLLGAALDLRALHRALGSLSLPGRLEQLLRIPPLYIDGAHNPAAAQKLSAWLEERLGGGRIILVVGVLADKDVDGILSALCPRASTVICTQAQSSRAMPAMQLAARASKLCDAEVFIHPSVGGAIESAIDAWRSGDVICVTGSLYTAGEARAAVRGMTMRP
ncbi:MAG: bifunctional folylpolyglutamate synthase/dihydrofolate synthase [Actinobacteria bacterium]|nr:MAG: bifunctional folylpolyglutamate synthase/dihydrofolate synthase [Actinomycetota bacterium]